VSQFSLKTSSEGRGKVPHFTGGGNYGGIYGGKWIGQILGGVIWLIDGAGGPFSENRNRGKGGERGGKEGGEREKEKGKKRKGKRDGHGGFS